MPIYYLKPVVATLEHADWASSTFRGACWVNAASETEARGIASGKFQDGGATIIGVKETPSPWRQPDLVTAQEVAEAPSGMTIPENTVVAEN